MAVKKFRVVLDGIAHEVEVEELGASVVSSVPAPEAATAPMAAPAVPKAAAPKPAAAAGAITAPLQGTVLDVPVKAGQAVKAGQILVVIEAMKMENEVVAPADGTVASVSVQKGDAVAAGDPLVTLQ